MKKNRHFQLAAVTAFLFSAASATAGEFSFDTGAEYTEGDYGTGSDTTALYIPLTFSYDTDTFGWSLTLPYLSVTGTGEVVYSRTGVRAPAQTATPTGGSGWGDSGSGWGQPGGDGTTTNTTTTTTTTALEEHTESGMGDVTLSGTYRLLQGEADKPSLAMTARVKFATADETKYLGTGENDYSVQLETGLGNFYGHLGYLVIGDTAITDYDDIFYGAIGVSVPLGNWNVGGEYYTEQEVMDGVDPVREVTLSVDHGLGKDNWLSFYLIKGFTDSSADWGTGLGITHYF